MDNTIFLKDPILFRRSEAQISVKERGMNRYIVIYVSKILSVQKSNNKNYVNIYFVGNSDHVHKIETRGRVRDFDSLLPNNFFRVERSTVINLAFLSEYTQYECTLKYRNYILKYFMTNDVSTKIIEVDF